MLDCSRHRPANLDSSDLLGSNSSAGLSECIEVKRSATVTLGCSLATTGYTWSNSESRMVNSVNNAALSNSDLKASTAESSECNWDLMGCNSV